MRPIYFNGKFYSRHSNGVHRTADQLIRGVDRALDDLPPGKWPPRAAVFLPACRHWEPCLRNIDLVSERHGESQLWEQFVLPVRASGGVLVNLCNLAPLGHRHKLLMLHDAQFLFPDSSYPRRLKWGYRLLTPIMARTSARVVTVSTYSRQMLDLLGVSPLARTDVIYNGADHMLEVPVCREVVHRLNLTPGRYAVHIASPKSYKNTAVVFAAFSAPPLANTMLVLVGPDEPTLRTAGLKPPSQAVFAGRVDDGELRAIYESALCVLLPSSTEGFGLPAIEAMICGCPAVTSPAGAIPEVCRDTVLYASVDAPADWIAAIQRYATDPALRQGKVAAGRARAADFTWAAAGRALLAVIAAV